MIRAEKKFERKDDKENYHFVERSYGTYQRAVRVEGESTTAGGKGSSRSKSS